jgi:hypothetical protein
MRVRTCAMRHGRAEDTLTAESCFYLFVLRIVIIAFSHAHSVIDQLSLFLLCVLSPRHPP